MEHAVEAHGNGWRSCDHCSLTPRVAALEERAQAIDITLLPELGRHVKVMGELTNKLSEVAGVVEELVHWREDTKVQRNVAQQKLIDKLEGQIADRKARWIKWGMNVLAMLVVGALGWIAKDYLTLRQSDVRVSPTSQQLPVGK